MENENNLEENEVVENSTIDNNEAYENVVIEDTNITTLETIHTDLSVIISFIIFGVLVILLIYVYKFFDMFFKI